jgi:translation initiation factor eIF-2B subunit gamma
MTTNAIPKHLLPVAGIPSIVRLIESLSAFSQIVIGVSEHDTKTLPTLLGKNNNTDKAVASLVRGPEEQSPASATATETAGISSWELSSETKRGQTIHVVKLSSEDCYGSVDALRIIEETKLIHPQTRTVVFPGDLVILQNKKQTTDFLNPLIRPASDEVACTAMLVDVLEQDENGLPLKESAKVSEEKNVKKIVGYQTASCMFATSACGRIILLTPKINANFCFRFSPRLVRRLSKKAKRGGLSRDKEDIEYIALSFPQSQLPSSSSWLDSNKSSLPRIVLKKSKLDVEADEDMTGSTAKLVIPKSKLRGRESGERLVIRTEWSDVHVYSLAPWVRQLIVSRTKNFSSIQEDLVPLLISRQYRGKRATFGKSALAKLAKIQNGSESERSASANDPTTSAVSSENTAPNQSGGSPESPTVSNNEGSESSDDNNKLSKKASSQLTIDDEPYLVSAVVLPAKSTLRANTVPAYLFACKEAVANCGSDETAALRIPNGSKRNGKFQTLTLEGSTLGSKINMKSSIVGKSCTLGAKCRLNNVIIMDNVTIGDQCSLQNTLIGFGAKLGNNVSLNDCQVGPGMVIPSGTKEKGEPFVVGDNVMESDAEMML